MTAGIDGKTIDAMSVERINKIILSLKDESYQPKPARRKYIPKKNGKLRPLGIPSIDDKLVQEVVRMLLEAIYEGSFENTSHGFRPNKSCHTALLQVQQRFSRCKWFVEGDIKGFFDNINHEVLISILRKRIEDERFLNLIRKFLNAGYMEEMVFHKTYSGTPQGGILSPILANIYLDQFDKYIKEYKHSFDKGKTRAYNHDYLKLSWHRHVLVEKADRAKSEETRKAILAEIKELDILHKSMPCKDPIDENYRRLQYVRYADDFLIGVIGAKADAEKVKKDIGTFIAEKLKLELSQEKTLITKATDKARFLGYDIRVTPQTNQTKRTKKGIMARNYSGHVMLEVPTTVVQAKLLALGAMKIKVVNGTEIWKSKRREPLVGREDIFILTQYNGEVRGFCNYYSIANNRSKLHKFRCIMEYSFYKTLASKYRTSKRKIIAKYRVGKEIGVRYTDEKGVEKFRAFWKGSLKRDKFAKGNEADFLYKPVHLTKQPTLSQRLQGNRCEWCGSETDDLVVHQVRSLKGLEDGKPWTVLMKKINRKTLIVCRDCHAMIHQAD